jgi:hypothetical protein
LPRWEPPPPPAPLIAPLHCRAGLLLHCCAAIPHLLRYCEALALPTPPAACVRRPTRRAILKLQRHGLCCLRHPFSLT